MNHCATVLVDTVRDLAASRREAAGLREAYEVAVHLLAERENEIKTLREQQNRRRDEYRKSRERAMPSATQERRAA